MGESFYYFKLGFDCTTSLQFLLLKQSAERTYLSPIINTDIKESLPFSKLTIIIFDTDWPLSAVCSPYRCMKYHFIKVAYSHLKNSVTNQHFVKFCKPKSQKKL